MKTIILVPGGGGSELYLNKEKVWPPTPDEWLNNFYSRINKLLDPNVTVGGIFEYLLCYEAYLPLQQFLDDNFVNADPQNYKRVNFPYDWRKCYFGTADLLAATIQSCVENGSTSIALVCHSSGNLAARLVLESRKYSSNDWFKNTPIQYVAICGPHFGVPRILLSVLGKKDFMTISGNDIFNFGKDPRYPGCYQCLPFENAPHYSLWNTPQGGSDQPVDFYIPANAAKLQLGLANLSAAKALQCALSLERPTNVDYHILAGQDQTTVERIEYKNWVYQSPPDDDTQGDSMLPLWTSNLPPFPQWIVSCDHLGILRSPQFQTELYQILTGNVSTAFLKDDGMTLSLNDVTYSPGEEISIILLPDKPTQRISGELEVAHYDPKLKRFKKAVPTKFVYDGPNMNIRSVRAITKAPDEPGAYQISFNGSHSTAKRPAAIFIVRKP
jgi:hypothetical protein